MDRDSLRILVVEDDSLVADVIVDTLDPTYQATTAETCAAALASLRQGGIDLILLDCTLPGGVDATLLAEADAARVPVLVMSGHPEAAERIAGGKRPTLLKPFSLDTLLVAVQQAMPATAA